MEAIKEYKSLPSYKLVIVIKRCRSLIKARPEYRGRLESTIAAVKDILIERQQVRQANKI